MRSIIGSGGQRLWEDWEVSLGKRFREFVDREIVPNAAKEPVYVPGESR